MAAFDSDAFDVDAFDSNAFFLVDAASGVPIFGAFWLRDFAVRF